MARPLLALCFWLAPLCLNGQETPPRMDHHQHLFSPAMVELITGKASGSAGLSAIAGADLVRLLDSAGIGRALVLSVAYIYGSPARKVDDEYAKVRAENDWTAAQAAAQPGRLMAFCGVNPLKDYAIEEIDRCASGPQMGRGLKLHFGNSDVQLKDTAHVAQLRRVFQAANRHRMALVVHLRANISRKRPYGADEARVFLDELLPLAPDVVVQVAHLAGSGPGYEDPPADSALAVLAAAVASGDRRTRNVWFDVTTVANGDLSTEETQQLVSRIRQIGVARILFGSDAAAGDNLRPRESWAAFGRLPLTPDEFREIASNRPPYAP